MSTETPTSSGNFDASVELVDGLPKAELGEGIVWCDRISRLWWVDIDRSILHCSDPETGDGQCWNMPSHIGCLGLTDSNRILVALSCGLHLFDPQTETLEHLVDLPGEASGNRPNDGAVSRAGRFYVGTIPLGDRSTALGNLYVFDGEKAERIADGLHIANGLAFSPDGATAYMSDSWPDVRTIWAFDHSALSGALSNRREFFDTNVTAGRPDGACVDSEGGYWMAGVGGGELLRLTSDGEVNLRILLPVQRPSKPCFGGADLNTLFVTSIGEGTASDAPDGRILRIDVPFTGFPEPRMKLK